MISTFVLIGRCDYFSFDFTTLNQKALYQNSIPRRSTQFSNGRLVDIGPSSSRGLAAVIVNIGPEDQKNIAEGQSFIVYHMPHQYRHLTTLSIYQVWPN